MRIQSMNLEDYDAIQQNVEESNYGSLAEAVEDTGEFVILAPDRDRALLSEERPDPQKALGLSSFWGDPLNSLRESVSGTAVCATGTYFGDQVHRFNVHKEFSHYQLVVANHPHTRTKDGSKLKDVVAEMRERIGGHLYEMALDIGTPDMDKIEEITEEVLDYLLWESWFKAGIIEREVRLALERVFECETVGVSHRYDQRHETPISELTQWDNPESAGIDLLVKADENVTVQVKSEGGGAWHYDHEDAPEADLIARVYWKEYITPRIVFEKNEAATDD